jgi:hypothetical protein
LRMPADASRCRGLALVRHDRVALWWSLTHLSGFRVERFKRQHACGT